MTTEVSPPSSPPAIQTAQGGSSNEYETPAAAVAAAEPPPLLLDQFWSYSNYISMKGVDGTHPPVGPWTTTPFQAVNVGGGNQGHAHVIDATLQRQYDIIARDLSTRGADDLDFTVPEAAIDVLMTAIGGNYSTDPTQKNARDALVKALLRCPKHEGPNFTCVELLDRCMELFHIDIQPDGTSENGAGRCGKKMSTFL